MNPPSLKQRLASRKLLVAPGVHDMVSLRLADSFGFEALYMGGDPVASKLHRAVHHSLLGSLAQTNRRLARLISELRLSLAHERHAELSAAYHGQLVAGEQAPGRP